MTAALQPTPLLQAELRIAGRLDARFFALLQALAATGSINRAARTAGYTYKGAWLVLDAAHNLAAAPLIETARGGTTLTTAGRALLAAWHGLEAARDGFVRVQEAQWRDDPALAGLIRRLAMKTSARNPFVGTVTDVSTGPVGAEVKLALPGGQVITASLTAGSVAALGLERGVEAVALVKASSVVLVTDFAGWRLSARNQLAGTVSRIERGAVSSLVGVTLPGGAVITASVTNDAVSALGLAVGQAATAVFKASAVMLAVAAPDAAQPAAAEPAAVKASTAAPARTRGTTATTATKVTKMPKAAATSGGERGGRTPRRRNP